MDIRSKAAPGTALVLVGCVALAAQPGTSAKPDPSSLMEEARTTGTLRVPADGAKAEVNAVLDSLHHLASKADGEAYFALFTPDAVFLGTDATERWNIEQFRAFAHPYFSKGQGWTYTSHDRHLSLSKDGATAWFDEALENAKYGACRGSGVLVQIDGAWKIAQYNLSVPIPNDLLEDVARQIREYETKEPAAKP
ncbi:MAG: nuclear transport factor 2 family protein [Phycisphaeraceae bacterium]|nr:nuclear transport factor 2 family protein [Phycisphaeraceae bacterium]